MPKKILLIEDSMASADFTSKALESEGYEVSLAKNGAEGFQKAVQGGFDLVIIDIMLPDVNGLEVCREIKVKLAKECPKLIALTGVIDAIEAVAARKAGADDFCVKTKDMLSLVEAVKKLF
ncbi:MAG: response regulator transcription factor [Candidatus Omnitrophica bacterium]|nr:response regulator transcription factor [Candidatus Omnitrophota bacterium]